MRRNTRTVAVLSALALAAGCNSLPERVETLEQARTLIGELEQDPLAQEVAPDRLETAQEALARAERSYEENEPLDVIEHDAYVALRNAQIAEQQIAEQQARERLEQGEAERNRVLLQAREREAEQAQQVAEERAAQLESQSRELEQQTAQTEQARQRAAALEEQTQALTQQTEQLERELADLEAEQTERGWVLTLDDVLFDVDSAALKPGAATTMDRIANFLAQHPERNIVIEGHTDASGPAAYNRELSGERARAVQQALADRGIEASRIEVRPLGEEYPVASNDSSAGRQLNRRVELVLSDESGRFAGQQRAASAEPEETER